jgi:hypothetical protein
MGTKLAFLTSVRFWAVVAIAIVGVLQTEGIITAEVSTALITILGGFVGLKTIDKFGKSIGGN